MNHLLRKTLSVIAVITVFIGMEWWLHPMQFTMDFIREQAGYYYSTPIEAYNHSIHRHFASAYGSSNAIAEVDQTEIENGIIWIAEGKNSLILVVMDKSNKGYRYRYAFCDQSLNNDFSQNLESPRIIKDGNIGITYVLTYLQYMPDYDSFEHFVFEHQGVEYSLLYRFG